MKETDLFIQNQFKF